MTVRLRCVGYRELTRRDEMGAGETLGGVDTSCMLNWPSEYVHSRTHVSSYMIA